jgi:branched-chain amino acid transport system substrate-binding protein
MTFNGSRLLGALSLALFIGSPVAQAQTNYVAGASVGLTGYAAAIDGGWVEGVRLALDHLNQQGGLLGKKIQLVVEDNRSEPQEAVAAYRKMISADGVKVFVSGCLSAGNFAAAPFVVRQKIPMVVCSILPKEAESIKWMYSLLPFPGFEVDTRLAYLRDKTKIREIGVLYDQSPYATLAMKLAQETAGKFGIKVVGAEQYQQSDVDLSVHLKKLHAAGARAILRMGTGPSTVTIAKNVKELALGIPVLTSSDDFAMLIEGAKVLGKDMFFVAGQTQVYSSLSDSDPAKKVIGDFIGPWRKKHGERDAFWPGRGYDAVMILAMAVRKAKSHDGEKVRDALDTISGYQGTSGIYSFDKSHSGVTQNPFVLAQIVDGKIVIVR